MYCNHDLLDTLSRRSLPYNGRQVDDSDKVQERDHNNIQRCCQVAIAIDSRVILSFSDLDVPYHTSSFL